MLLSMAHQKGYIYEASGKFYVKYRTTKGAERKQTSHFLCNKDDLHRSRSDKSVKVLRDKYMLTVNEQQSQRGPGEDMPVVTFWTQRYLPFVEGNLKPATVHGYRQIWSQHLEKHFGTTTLQSYRTHIGSQFLLSLTPRLGRRTLNHIRSLASGIFTHAINEGRLETNPWHAVKILGKVREPENTRHYTLEEAENIISALVDHVDAQLVIALSFFVALRPGEIAGLRWEDFDANAVHLRRSVVHGIVGTPKTSESSATLPLIPQVRVPLELWRRACGAPTEGWVFENSKGKPADLSNMVDRIIRPTLEARGLQWKSLYAARRGAATAVIGLTNGNIVAAQELLRHKSVTTTLQAYKKQTQSALADGLKALSEAASPERAIEPEGSTE